MKLNFNVFLLSSLSNIMCIHLLSCMLSVWTLQTGEKFDIIFKYTPDNREIREKLSFTIARKKGHLKSKSNI